MRGEGTLVSVGGTNTRKEGKSPGGESRKGREGGSLLAKEYHVYPATHSSHACIDDEYLPYACIKYAAHTCCTEYSCMVRYILAMHGLIRDLCKRKKHCLHVGCFFHYCMH